MTAAPVARLFLALWPGPAVRLALHDQQAHWSWPRSARPVAKDKLHLTLHFLGDVAEDRLPALLAACRDAPLPAPHFTLGLDRSAVWRNGVAVLEPAQVPDALLALQAGLGTLLGALQLPLEDRRFRPHVTLARDATGATPPAQPPSIRWPVRHWALVRSRGGRYEPLLSCPGDAREPAAP